MKYWQFVVNSFYVNHLLATWRWRKNTECLLLMKTGFRQLFTSHLSNSKMSTVQASACHVVHIFASNNVTRNVEFQIPFVLFFWQRQSYCHKWLLMQYKAPFTLLRFCTKTERKTSVFVKVFTLICTKTPQKRRFANTLSKVDIHKNGGFWKRIWSMWTHKNGGFWKRSSMQQWVSQKRSNVNAQKRMFFAAFLLSGRSVWTHKNGGFLTVFVQKRSSVNG